MDLPRSCVRCTSAIMTPRPMSDSRSRGSRRCLSPERTRHHVLIAALALATMRFAVGCGGGSSLTPSGSTMLLSTSTADVPFNGTATLVAQLVQAGDQMPPDGTMVTFVATLGSVQPAQAPT